MKLIVAAVSITAVACHKPPPWDFTNTTDRTLTLRSENHSAQIRIDLRIPGGAHDEDCFFDDCHAWRVSDGSEFSIKVLPVRIYKDGCSSAGYVSAKLRSKTSDAEVYECGDSGDDRASIDVFTTIQPQLSEDDIVHCKINFKTQRPTTVEIDAAIDICTSMRIRRIPIIGSAGSAG